MAAASHPVIHDAAHNSAHLFHFTVAKAGMDGLDREKINQQIYELSKNSAYFKNQKQRDEVLSAKVIRLRQALSGRTEFELRQTERNVQQKLIQCEAQRDLTRTWAVFDMDMCVFLSFLVFFAAVEMRDDPSLIGKPVAVGGMKMISTANYEARRFGVRSAMPGFIALKLCPTLVFVDCHFEKYEEAAKQTRIIFADYDVNFESLLSVSHFVMSLIQSMSLDEAYLDLTEYLVAHPKLTVDNVSAEIRQRICVATGGLTASGGIACNRMLAKICSDVNKPNGQFHLPSEKNAIISFLDKLSVRKIPGIGRVCEALLKAFEIETVLQLRDQAAILPTLFSPSSLEYFLRIALGLAETRHEVPDENEPAGANRKSMSCDRTFDSSMCEETGLLEQVRDICTSLAQQMQDEHLHAKTVSIKIKLASFVVKQKAITLPRFISSFDDIFSISCALFHGCFDEEFSITADSTSLLVKPVVGGSRKTSSPRQYTPIRLVGVRLSTFEENQHREKITKNQPLMSQFLSVHPRSHSLLLPAMLPTVIDICNSEDSDSASAFYIDLSDSPVIIDDGDVNIYLRPDNDLRSDKSGDFRAPGIDAPSRVIMNRCHPLPKFNVSSIGISDSDVVAIDLTNSQCEIVDDESTTTPPSSVKFLESNLVLIPHSSIACTAPFVKLPTIDLLFEAPPCPHCGKHLQGCLTNEQMQQHFRICAKYPIIVSNDDFEVTFCGSYKSTKKRRV